MEKKPDRQEFSQLEDLLQQVDVKTALQNALNEILTVDFRQDQFRTLKIFLLYQAGIMDDIEARLRETNTLLTELIKKTGPAPREVKKRWPVVMKK